MDQQWDPPSESFAAPTMVEVAPSSAPSGKRPRRVGLWIGVGAVTIAALVGVVAVTSRDDESSDYSLAAAAETASEAQNVAYELTMSGMGQEVSAAGRLDVGEGLMAMTMGLPAPISTEIDAVFDLDAQVIYMDASMFGDLGFDAPTEWISFDLTVVPGMEEAFSLTSQTNPLDVARLFTLASDVQEVGMEDINGEPAMHYEVTVAIADVLDDFPELAESIDQMGVAMDDEIVYDVWVDGNDQLRRVTYSTSIDGQELTMDIVYTAIGDIEPIEVPPTDEVTDLTEMMGG